MTPAEQEQVRNARIRRLRAEREGTARRLRGRPLQPLVLLGWIGGVIALTVIVLYLAVLALSPAIMAWVEQRPTLIQNELIVDFVNWYRPEAIADEAASDTYRRVSIEIPPGATDAFIGQLLVTRGLIHSELAFHHQVYQADREGNLQAGQYDLSPTMRPSFIIAALRQEAGPEVTITILEGLRLEEVVAYLGSTDLTMDLDEFRGLVTTPPPDLLAAYPFLAELPAGRTLEGYLYPDTYRVFANATARAVVERLLTTFDQRLSQEIRDQLAVRRRTRGRARRRACPDRGCLHPTSADRGVEPGRGSNTPVRARHRGIWRLADVRVGNRPLVAALAGRRGGDHPPRDIASVPDLPGRRIAAHAHRLPAHRVARGGCLPRLD
ncbi:MAG: endolytic transglycosylase MltG [Chloroflexota bacterium]